MVWAKAICEAWAAMASAMDWTPWPMLMTAAWPDASRYSWPSEEMIEEPSPRTAVGKDFLKFREKREVTRGNCSKHAKL